MSTMSRIIRRARKSRLIDKSASQATVISLSNPETLASVHDSPNPLSLNAYLNSVELAHHEPAIRSAIAQGAQDVFAVMTNPRSVDEIHRLARKTRELSVHAQQVTNIMWYFFSLALRRNQHFMTGAFLCSDPSGRLSAYFRGIGTPRLSSHLKRHSAPGCTGGIDLNGSSSATTTPTSFWKGSQSRGPPLPHDHRHVLYIAIADDPRRGNCLFLKPERHGVAGVRNLAHHAAQYAKSLRRRYTFGANEVLGMRKERIPDRLVAAFAETVAPLPDGALAIAEVGRHGEGEGIGGMHAFLTSKLADPEALPESVHAPMRALLAYLLAEYDFVASRFGNEVFLDLTAELAGLLPEAPGVGGPSILLQ
ncbi:hypothetical protein B0T18DRAFT_402451 [Schizothecium vesticola]|uniref:Uncharacterized protein n=1 Tax=Schizothecium vesticola TaxID=314040 RepID=A0AA40F536_9PEZI|nr:hypothetical protein B0T18DRAFT_402451 [Schizothecium vesticola]